MDYFIIYVLGFVYLNIQGVMSQCVGDATASLNSTFSYYNGPEYVGWFNELTEFKCYYGCQSQPCNDMNLLLWELNNVQVVYHLWSGDPTDGIPLPGFNDSIVFSKLGSDDYGNYSQLTWVDTTWKENSSTWQCTVQLVSCPNVITNQKLLVFDENVYVQSRTFDDKTLAELEKDDTFKVEAQKPYPATFKVKSQPESRLNITSTNQPDLKLNSNSTNQESGNTNCVPEDEYFICTFQTEVTINENDNVVNYIIEYFDPTTGAYGTPRRTPTYEDGYVGEGLLLPTVLPQKTKTCLAWCIPVFLLLLLLILFLIHVIYIFLCGPEYNRGHWKCICCKKNRFYCDLCHSGCSKELCEECEKKDHCSASRCKQQNASHKSKVSDANTGGVGNEHSVNIPDPDYN